MEGPAVTAGADHTCGLVVPAYFHPAVLPRDWSALASVAGQVRLVVLNIASGVGAIRDGEFLPVLASLRAAGVTIAGYVDSGYGARKVAEAAAEIERYSEWYGINGVFFDRSATRAEHLDHYAALAAAARDLGVAVVAFNHGAHPAPGYSEYADMLGTFEGPWPAYLKLAVPNWVRSRPAEQFFHLVYAVPSPYLAYAADLARRWHAVAYATSIDGPNPWQCLATSLRDAPDT